VPDPAGGFSPLDLSLRHDPADGRLEPTRSMSPASFATNAGAADMARLDLGDGVSLGFGVTNAAAVPVVAQGDAAVYRGLRPNADLELSATTFGLKESIVLRSAAAPTSWLFPLRTLGATPTWDAASGSVRFVDRRGNTAAVIPPGFMVDSSFDPVTGGQRRSNNVRYTLIQDGANWSLRVDLTRPGCPTRPACSRSSSTRACRRRPDDTFVSSRDYANRNNSNENELLIGTYDWGGERAASYLHFDSAIASLANAYVTSATLKLYNSWSYGCTAMAASVHAVTSSWAGATTTSWSGPGSEATPLQTNTFAYGYPGLHRGRVGVVGPAVEPGSITGSRGPSRSTG
jgi:hypothetical protein